MRASLPPKHVLVVRGYSEHGGNMLRAGRFAEAEGLLREALSAAAGSPADRRTVVVPIERDLAVCIGRQGRRDEALQRLRELDHEFESDEKLRRELRELIAEFEDRAERSPPDGGRP